MKPFLKKQQGFTLIELMIAMAIVGILASIAIPSYKDYMTSAKWAKTIFGVRALKLAIENCLSDNGGAFNQCDALDNGKIAAYGVNQYATENEEFSQITLKPNTAEIEITGKQALSFCILTIRPSFTTAVGMITWGYVMTAGNTAFADVTKCRSYVKGATAS